MIPRRGHARWRGAARGGVHGEARVARRRLGFWRRFAVALVKPTMLGLDPAHLDAAWSTSRRAAA